MKELLKAFGITEVRIDPDLSDSYRALIKSFLVQCLCRHAQQSKIQNQALHAYHCVSKRV